MFGRKKKQEEMPVIKELPRIRESPEVAEGTEELLKVEKQKSEAKTEIRLVTSEQLLISQLGSLAERQDALNRMLEIAIQKLDMVLDLAKE